MKELKQFIKKEIANITFKDVMDDDSLITSGLLDSITLVDLVVSIEDESDIEIPFTDINKQNFETLNTIMTYLDNKE